VISLVRHLRTSLNRENGPFERRPSYLLFQTWISKALTLTTAGDGVIPARARSDQKPGLPPAPRGGPKPFVGESVGVVPLHMLIPEDARMMRPVIGLLRSLPEAALWSLQMLTFPRLMKAQPLKLSSSGQELGSPSLFGVRLGFSGTPSSLLPTDLVPCRYEPGSEGQIVTVLCSPRHVQFCIKKRWTVESLLRDIANADPPFHALIDTGKCSPAGTRRMLGPSWRVCSVRC
jgi:hypothetical protein